jgi:RNA polymerase primary sigma factor
LKRKETFLLSREEEYELGKQISLAYSKLWAVPFQLCPLSTYSYFENLENQFKNDKIKPRNYFNLPNNSELIFFYQKMEEWREILKTSSDEFSAERVEQSLQIARELKPGRVIISQLLKKTKKDPDPKIRALVTAREKEYAFAKNNLATPNLCLVISIAKKYCQCGLPFEDLIQEGNIGLLRATETYDWRKGYKFSTYATWWIRQMITRALADTSRIIRIPVHKMDELINYLSAETKLYNELEREPTPEEVVKFMHHNKEKTKDNKEKTKKIDPKRINSLRYYNGYSLDELIGDEENTPRLAFYGDRNLISPEEFLFQKRKGEKIDAVLETLPTERERQIIRMRFGLGNCGEHTLEEVGNYYGFTRERARQIQATALAKLRLPSRKNQLKDLV